MEATTNQQKQFEALMQSAKNISEMFNVHIFKSEDKRKNDLFYLTYFGATKSPKLDYSNMNHFLQGMHTAIKMYNCEY